MRYNTLHPIEYSSFIKVIDEAKKTLKEKLGENFLEERYDPHITFIYHGKHPEVNEIREECLGRFNELPDEAKAFTFGNVEVFHGRRNYLVVKLEIDPRVSQLREELYEKYNIRDKIKVYNPHVTLGILKEINWCSTDFDDKKYEFKIL